MNSASVQCEIKLPFTVLMASVLCCPLDKVPYLFVYLFNGTACSHISEYGLDSASEMDLYVIWTAEHRNEFSFARG